MQSVQGSNSAASVIVQDVHSSSTGLDAAQQLQQAQRESAQQQQARAGGFRVCSGLRLQGWLSSNKHLLLYGDHITQAAMYQLASQSGLC